MLARIGCSLVRDVAPINPVLQHQMVIAVRGEDHRSDGLFSYLRLEQRVPIPLLFNLAENEGFLSLWNYGLGETIKLLPALCG
jgi:hypothetical protein